MRARHSLAVPWLLRLGQCVALSVLASGCASTPQWTELPPPFDAQSIDETEEVRVTRLEGGSLVLAHATWGRGAHGEVVLRGESAPLEGAEPEAEEIRLTDIARLETRPREEAHDAANKVGIAIFVCALILLLLGAVAANPAVSFDLF